MYKKKKNTDPVYNESSILTDKRDVISIRIQDSVISLI